MSITVLSPFPKLIWFNPHSNPLWLVLLSPFCRWGLRLETWSHLPQGRVPQLQSQGCNPNVSNTQAGLFPWAPIVTIILELCVGISASFFCSACFSVWLQSLALYHSVPICLRMLSYDCWCPPKFCQLVCWVISFFKKFSPLWEVCPVG